MLVPNSNIYQSLLQRAKVQPDAVAIVFEEQSWSYHQLLVKVNQTMLWLTTTVQLKKGDRIVLGWGNTIEFCQLFYAAVGLGIQVIPLSTKMKEFEGKEHLSCINADAVFWDDTYQPWLAQLSEKGVSLSQWNNITLTDEINFINQVNEEDPAVVIFTSGTTGAPKGAVITHKNILSAVYAYQETLKLTEHDKTILAVPIYHITGLSAILALFIHIGGTIYLQKKFNAKDIISTIAKEKITFLHGSPTVFILLIQKIKENKSINLERFNSLKKIACGAGHLNEGTIKELSYIFAKTSIHSVYGLTETSSPATVFRDDIRYSDKKASSGTPIPGLEVAIRDDKGEDKPANTTGNIWVKGDVVIQRYWPDSPANKTSFNDGWFFTGDIGYRDDDGFLYIQDRIKDMINRGGEKIYSIEIEDLISNYPGVNEVAVIPIESTIYGEEPIAFIIPENQVCLTSKEIIEWLKDRVPTYKVPVRIIFTRNFPRTWNGKISKKDLKLRYYSLNN
ncbi:class I adenylate-forming enzyme family protein [Providencia rettgeri]|uniref:class I adenylate-forming enzyme family protein n=1 Tax=Providencia TaxID=586 RepID=UPI001BD41519|nr:class I adenylate-forming enzyme family protein [Providencia rettgeri]ELR5073449.1 acyl--CoA ligase [Providencia stuartii]ELR5070468.1 acyl--CoA ligase [Providencia rettgeri]ELR5222362.1 acyl--CoA ligase [Providencia rettgeri]MDX7322299.1 class I adenylate-forming enzyme family protein [Providencia rettgeri]UPS62536.1 acyl--CoA ligase [Providencia rettgeri]